MRLGAKLVDANLGVYANTSFGSACRDARVCFSLYEGES